MFRKLTVIAGFALALSAGMAHAEDTNYSFNIKNDSNYIISAFQTNDGDGWSTNWLNGDQVGAGETQALQFTQDGPCEIQVKVSWRTTDGGQTEGEPWNIDICKAHTVYFDGEKVTFD